MGFLGGSAGKEYAQNSRDLGLIPVLGRSPGEGNRYPLQYSGLENSMNCIVHGVIKGRTPLSDFHFTSSYYHCYFFCSFPGGSDGKESACNAGDLREIWVQFLDWEDPLEKEMAIHSKTHSWKIQWTEEPGRLQSMGWQSWM